MPMANLTVFDWVRRRLREALRHELAPGMQRCHVI